MLKKRKFFILLFNVLALSSVAFLFSSTNANVVTQQDTSNQLGVLNTAYPNFDMDNLNLFSGKTTNASNNANDAQNVLDGDYNTSWIVSNAKPESGNTNTLSLEVDLGKPTQLKALKVRFLYRNVKSFALDYQDSSSNNWKTIANMDNGDSVGYYINLANSINATKVRIRIIDWSLVNGAFRSNPLNVVGIRNFEGFKYDLDDPGESNPNLLEGYTGLFTTSAGNKVGSLASDNNIINPDSYWEPRNFDDVGITVGHQYQIDTPKQQNYKAFRIIFKNPNIREATIRTKNPNISFRNIGNTSSLPMSSLFVFNVDNEGTRDINTILLTILRWRGTKVQVLDIAGYAQSLPYTTQDEYFDFTYQKYVKSPKVQIYTQESINEYTNNLNKIKSDYMEDKTDATHINEYITRMFKTPGLQTYKQSLINKIQKIEKEINIDSHNNTYKNTFLNTIREAKSTIDTTHRLTKLKYDALSDSIDIAKNNLINPSKPITSVPPKVTPTPPKVVKPEPPKVTPIPPKVNKPEPPKVIPTPPKETPEPPKAAPTPPKVVKPEPPKVAPTPPKVDKPEPPKAAPTPPKETPEAPKETPTPPKIDKPEPPKESPTPPKVIPTPPKVDSPEPPKDDTTTNPETEKNSEVKNKTLSNGVIIGISVGILVFLSGTLITFYYWLTNRQRNNKKNNKKNKK